MKKYLFLTFFALFSCLEISAEDAFGGWQCLNFSYHLDKEGKWTVGDYFQCEEYNKKGMNS